MFSTCLTTTTNQLQVCFASQSISSFKKKKLENQLARARSILFSVHGEIRWYKCWKFQKCSRKTQNTAVIAVYVPCCGAKSHPNLCLGTFYRLRSPLRLTQSDSPGSNGWPTRIRGTHIDWGLTWNEWVQHCNNSENHETSLSIVQNPASSLEKLGGWERGSLLMNCDNRQDIG